MEHGSARSTNDIKDSRAAAAWAAILVGMVIGSTGCLGEDSLDSSYSIPCERSVAPRDVWIDECETSCLSIINNQCVDQSAPNATTAICTVWDETNSLNEELFTYGQAYAECATATDRNGCLDGIISLHPQHCADAVDPAAVCYPAEACPDGADCHTLSDAAAELISCWSACREPHVEDSCRYR